MILRPWAKVALKVLIGLLALSVVLVIAFYFYNLERRVSTLEAEPDMIITQVTVTPEPTASPTATLEPTRTPVKVVPTETE